MSTNSIVPNKIAGEQLDGEQTAWLDGFFDGLKNRGVSFADAEPEAGPKPKKEKITNEEKIKNELDPFNAFDEIGRKAKKNIAPEKEDIFRFKWNGLFWLAPVHEGYMCRLRIPGGKVKSFQLKELASIADDIASGFLQITTRNNFQVRVVQPKDTPELLRRIQDCGLHSRGSGADNMRNFTGNPTSGVDKYELIDVMPLIDDLSHTVINQADFYNLPRKFNVSFDSGGIVGVAEDTNDIGFRAIKLSDPPEGHPLHGKVEAGVYFEVLLGGVTGHQEFAEFSGIICRPDQTTDLVSALTRVFIRNGNRGNRGKARLIYLIKEWGVERYLEEAEALLDEPLIRIGADRELLDGIELDHQLPAVPHPHVGVHPQKQFGYNYVGVYVPVGILQTEEARAIADIADRYGSGEVRLTIFQNLIIPNVADADVGAVIGALKEVGLVCESNFIRGGVAACTGNQYCKFASSDTKGQAIDLVSYLEDRIVLDKPLNIHVTGCPHSCAQHYIGDIGLLACKVAVEGGGEPVEGYHVFVGGGFGREKKKLGRQLLKSVPAGEVLNTKIE
ncbi:MAG: NirA family protein, partial [Verrucomicrobiota bacterium]